MDEAFLDDVPYVPWTISPGTMLCTDPDDFINDRNFKLNPVETLEKVRSASHKWRSYASVEVGVMTHRSGRYRPKDILSKGRFT